MLSVANLTATSKRAISPAGLSGHDAPLTAGLLSPIKADAGLHSQRRSQLDRLYQRVVDDLDKLILAAGLKAA
jgi:hypothetical protein